MEVTAPVEGRRARRVSHSEERRLARSLSPAVAWPTLGLAAFLPLSFAGLVVAGLTGRAPLEVCSPLLAVVSYAHYTLVHEAIHGNIVARVRRLRWLNPLVGSIGAVGLGASWPVLKRTHLLHHSYTNGDGDPDLYWKGSLGRLVRKWAKAIPLSFVPLIAMRLTRPARLARLRTVLSDGDIIHTSALSAAQVGLFLAALASGRLLDWVCLWFLPTKTALLALHILFQWLPHHPFGETGRYRNTRISLWRGAAIATLQQNLHLVHHLWPSVPFYNYGRLFNALRPVLEAEGARIEGLSAGSAARG